jgi:hypothetical protein
MKRALSRLLHALADRIEPKPSQLSPAEFAEMVMRNVAQTQRYYDSPAYRAFWGLS